MLEDVFILKLREKELIYIFKKNRIKTEQFQTNQGYAAKKVLHMVHGTYHYLSMHWVPEVRRPQEKIKLIKFTESQKSSIKHLARRDYHMQDEQYLSKNLM